MEINRKQVQTQALTASSFPCLIPCAKRQGLACVFLIRSIRRSRRGASLALECAREPILAVPDDPFRAHSGRKLTQGKPDESDPIRVAECGIDLRSVAHDRGPGKCLASFIWPERPASLWIRCLTISEGNEEQRIVSVFFYNLLIVWYLCTVFFQS